nr:uncharacterized protein LOC104099012 [Nicotiana tomentosiformis]
MHDKLEKILPSLISTSQSGFVKGRSIFENILLTQEIVSDIRLRGKPANVVIKHDMAKTYDRVSSTGFFKSTRGVKQGDPLSPALFILSTEVLTRSMAKLFEDKRFFGYGMPKWTDPLNHLAYVDDTIIFASTDTYFLGKIVEVLRQYEQTSCQLINKSKSSYYMHNNVAGHLFQSVGSIIGILRGKATLISSVLQSLPTHILSLLDPPNNIIEHLHKTFARFYWSTKEEGRSRHWTKWQKLCLPKEEEG